MTLPYLSEVLKILDGALKSNASMASNYAGLLADKLDKDGDREQALRIRERLTRAPSAVAHAQEAGSSMAVFPMDADSRLQTVDMSNPSSGSVRLHLATGTEGRVREFLESVRHFDALHAAGAALPLRLLLYGAPGTGKTQTARWIASELSLPMLTVRCDTLVSSLLGQTSKNLRRVFEYADQRPCVLFLDEFDALGSARGNERDVGELQRVVIALLQNLDAASANTVLIAASNHEQLLDPAIWRRFPFRVPLPLPDASLRIGLWKGMLGTYAPANVDWKTLSAKSEGASGALIEQVVLDAKRSAVLGGKPQVDEGELMRRLGLALALQGGTVLPNVGDEIRWLRHWDTKTFSLRELARLYNVSIRQVTHLIEGEHGNEDKSARRR